jgi:hypothetical protein
MSNAVAADFNDTATGAFALPFLLGLGKPLVLRSWHMLSIA